MSNRVNHCYEFGPFRADAQKRLLLRDGAVVPLTPKAFNILLILLERPNEVLSKENLMQAVWPDVAVEENNLTRNISTLRKALGEKPDEHRYVVTLPGSGYCFVASVEQRAAEITEPGVWASAYLEPTFEPVADNWPKPTLQAAAVRTRLASRRGPVVVAIAASLIVGAGWFLVWQRPPVGQPDQIKSLAVLPPRPLQSGARDEALELGITSTLITRLSSLRQVIVRPESAIEKYTSHEQDPLAAGREQKVDAVLDCRYQRSGDKLRFTLRLLRVADGATLWADTLDQPTADHFAIGDTLSAKVTGALRLTLSSAEKEWLAKRYTNSAEAWQLYVRGRQLVHKRRVPDIEKAITYFERAIVLDQEFALAHAMLGFAYTSLNWVGNSPAQEVMPKAKAAYDRALRLDDQLAEAHTYLAQYKHTYEWDRSGAEQLHQRALELNPNSADVHHLYAFHLMFWGRSEQAIVEIRKAEELDPRDIWISRNVAQVLFFARRYDEAIEQSKRVTELNPNVAVAYGWMISAYEMKGDEQAAFATRLKRAEATGAGAEETAGIRAAFAEGGLKGCWRRELDRLLEREKSKYVGQLNIAEHYARVGDKEQALTRLERAVEERNLYVIALNIDPRWDNYRADPRFVALVRRIELAQRFRTI